MPLSDPQVWTDRLRATLQAYHEPLLRQVAGKLLKPRNQWPVEELIERSVATISNAAVVDRRLEELGPAGRRLLALIGHSRQPRWKLGSLLEMLAALGNAEGMTPVFALFESGLLYPELQGVGASGGPLRLKSFEEWLGQSSATGYHVFAHPHVSARAMQEDLGLPDCPGVTVEAREVREADGLEWPLRLSALWQQIAGSPLRRTQQGDFFKRDLDRLRKDPLLHAAPADGLAELPDAGLLAVALAEMVGLLQATDGELRAAPVPGAWENGLSPALEAVWMALPYLDSWNALDGWRGGPASANPYPSACLLAFLLLGKLPEGAWADPVAVEQWVLAHHPYWSADAVRPSRLRSWLPTFLLGLAYQLRLLQAAKDSQGTWLVRLSPLGRWLLGLADAPGEGAAYTQTLLVQPNLEIIAYRQGLSPGLIFHLAQFAAWKTLGAACTLQLQPDTVYLALESGQTFETLVQTLERHGMRPTPPAVIEALRTWANKHERIVVYPSATLFEFATGEDLNEALARGLPATRLGERLAVVVSENGVDFRHFRLTGTRDYGLPPEKCVAIESDGVTLTIDLARSDLLLETELQRFAEPLDRSNVNGRRQYRLTPASVAAGRESGLGLRALEEWFLQRSGQPLSAAARLLLLGDQVPPVELRRRLVLHAASADVADGIAQWPRTRALIQERLGPMALAVAEEDSEELKNRLQELGIQVEMNAPEPSSTEPGPA
jgi:hypothetical protein